MADRQEPYWVRACETCKRQLRDATSICCGEYGKTIYLVPAEQLRGAVEENGRLRAQLEDARVRLDERRVMLDEREATIRRLTAEGQSQVTAPSVITASADVDLVERLQQQMGAGSGAATDEKLDNEETTHG